ncbi:hypothetical protein SODALDRAFT_272888 [Sodiomyces alkalinus F11]|uniref:Glycoside hydrolase n=1 Tax=Sodiomyces alkalinus (strain CBS 110278 / VKM F-3762 / F11) TaxID=1314773 RepID=A0A3N2Q216_SODAK|nr:hypothetical protein SODALDRAFT_272888 [Sodiomyces alkalinus F11]ROT40813.1 hypothetical protein SODALDRAFT_272888 [Sodiomyces alkalinus F11]
MASQIPAGAEGTVVGVMFYCVVCLICSCLMVWLTWTHEERTSHVAMLAYFVTISIVASLTQQTYDIVRYNHIVSEQFWNRKQHPDNPEVAISNGSVGLSLVLYYIQYYCYSVESMIIMFWAAALAQSVYGLSSLPKFKVILPRINRGGKIFAMLFPLTTILLLRIPAVQDNFIIFILLADLPLMLSLFFGLILMLLILARYVHSKRKFLNWTNGVGGSGSNGSALNSNTPQGFPQKKKSRSIYDRWLLVRFTIGFVALSIFEVTNTLFQITAITNKDNDVEATEPDLSAERAKSSWIFFMPGVTPGLFIFIVFGTTTPLRRYMYEKFVPKRWQRRSDDRPRRMDSSPDYTDDVGPPVPPKPPQLSPGLERKIIISRPQQALPADIGRGRSKQAVVVRERESSDEFPMLPIRKTHGRYDV